MLNWKKLYVVQPVERETQWKRHSELSYYVGISMKLPVQHIQLYLEVSAVQSKEKQQQTIKNKFEKIKGTTDLWFNVILQ